MPRDVASGQCRNDEVLELTNYRRTHSFGYLVAKGAMPQHAKSRFITNASAVSIW